MSAAACMMTIASHASPPIHPHGADNHRVVLVGANLMPGADQYIEQFDYRCEVIPVLYDASIDPDHNLIPNWNLIESGINTLCSPGYSGVIALDWEDVFFETLKAGPTHPDFQKAINKGRAVANFVRNMRPNAKVGYYGLPTAHWNHVTAEDLQPLFDAMDVLLPSAYMAAPQTWEQNLTRLHNNTREALEHSNGKPVLVYHSPRKAGSHNLVDRDEWIAYLNESFNVQHEGRRAAGIILWDPTRRYLNQNILHVVDEEHVPLDMALDDYATQLQRWYICTAAHAIIPDIICNQHFPGEIPDIAVAEAEEIGLEEPGAPGEEPISGHIIEPDPVIAQGENDNNSGDDTGTVTPIAPPAITYVAGDAVEPGVNLAPLNPLISGSTFTNVLWTSSPWKLKDAQDNDVDAQRGEFGYPMPGDGQHAVTVIGENNKNNMMQGKWICKYDGTGDIDFTGDATVQQSTPGKIIFRVTPSNAGVTMAIRNVSSGDPIRNVRVMPFSYAKNFVGMTLHPQLVNRLTSERPKALRFAAWQKINGSTLEHWADRAHRDDVSQVGEAGAAYELMIELCNTLESDLWLCVPHMANDSFVESLAVLVRDTLHPSNRLIIEYSSDAMNQELGQFEYMVEQGSEILSGATDAESAAKYYGRRSKEVWGIMRSVFAAAPERLVCAYSVPGDSTESAQLVLARTGAVESANVIAISGGIGGKEFVDNLSHLTGVTNDAIVNMLIESRIIRMPLIKSVIEQVQATGKPYFGYGIGAGMLVHADGYDKNLILKLRNAERDSRIIEMTTNEASYWEREESHVVVTNDVPSGSP